MSASSLSSLRAPLAGALCLAVALGAAAPPAGAGSADPLTLADAVVIAERQAPALAARAAALESANAAIGPAGELPDPELVAGVDNLPVSGGDAFSVTRDFMTMRKIGVMQTFTRGEKRELRLRRAQADAQRQQALLSSERLGVRESAARAWIARWSSERRLALLGTLRARADAQVAAADAALSAGRGTAADAIAARAARAVLDDRVDQAERDAAQAAADFGRFLGADAERPLGAPPDWYDLGADPDALLAHIGKHRELAAYDALERAAQADVALARADKRPDWSVEFDLAQRGPRYSNMVSLEVRVPLPLFASRRQDPTIASRSAAAAQILAEREDALRMHAAELRKTLAAWRSAAERSRRFERELLPLADARVDAALAAYGGGRADLQSALAAFDAAVDQRIAYAEVLDALGQAWAVLHFAYPQES